MFDTSPTMVKINLKVVKNMSTEKKDDTVKKQNNEQKDINQKYIASIEEKQKQGKYGDLGGGRIVDRDRANNIEQEPVKPPLYKKYLTKKWGLSIAGVLAALFAALYFVFTGTPKTVAEEYINAIAAADYGKAYQCLEVKDEPTLSSSSYLQFVEFSRSSKEDNIYKLSQNEIKTIDLVEGKESNGILTFEADIVVKKQSGDEEHKYALYLEKKKTGPFGLFTAYRISGKGVYAVPKINCLMGTEQISIDNISLADDKNKLNLNKPVFYGWHDVEFKGKFYDTYQGRANFVEKSGILELDMKKIKLNTSCIEVLASASNEFAAAFFPATLTGNGYTECKTVPDEKTIDDMYTSFSKGFKQVGVSAIDIKSGQINSALVVSNGNIQCQYQYSGVYRQKESAEKQCVGTINFEYICDNGQLVVAKINDYNIHLKD